MNLFDKTFFKNAGIRLDVAHRNFDIATLPLLARVKFFMPFCLAAVPIFLLHSIVLFSLFSVALFLTCVCTTACDRFGKFIYRFLMEWLEEKAGGTFLSYMAVFKISKAKKLIFTSIVLAVPLSPPRFRLA